MVRCHYKMVQPINLYWLLLLLWTTYAVAQESACQDLQTSFASCLVDTFDLQSDAAACDNCRLEYSAFINNSTELLSCTDVETIECTAVRECPCNECGPILESYLNCEVVNNYNNNQCPSGIDCRTSTVNCENSFNEYRNCIYRLPINSNGTTTTGASGKMCDECRLNVANQFSDGGTCDAAQTNFCTGVNETCASVCGDCVDELDFFFTCDVLDKSNGNCQVDCNITSTPPLSDDPICNDDLSRFAFCITQDLTSDAEGVACDNCRINAETSILEASISTSAACTNIQQAVCSEAVPTCADVCGTCTASLAGYWICYLATISFVDCSSTNCISPPSPTVTPQPVSPTASNPIGIPTINQPLTSPSSVPVRDTFLPSNEMPRLSPVPSPNTPSTGSDMLPTSSAISSVTIFNGIHSIVVLGVMYFVIS